MISLWTSTYKIMYIVIKMIEDSNHLSPDIEWMLQSNQVDDATLIDILVSAYYESIYRIALNKLTYPAEAHRATQDTFFFAISGQRRFSEGLSVFDWLVSIAEEICQERRDQIETYPVLNPRLIQSLCRRVSTKKISARQLEDAKRAISAKIKSKKVAGVKRARIKEFLLLSSAFVVAFFLIRYIDLEVSSFGSPSETDQPISTIQVTPDPSSPKPSPTPSPPTSSTKAFPQQAPLTKNSTHDEIWKRILISRNLWDTLWADVWVILYGPANYIGPPRAERHQIWLDQDKGGIHLSGSLEGKPNSVERITTNGTGPEPTGPFTGTDYFSRFGSQIPWFYLGSDRILSTPYMSNYSLIANFGYPPQGVWYTVVEELEWANRKAVVVELTDYSGTFLARYWLDASTGLALREQYPDIHSQDDILLEIQVSKIEFDFNFPLSLYRATDDELLGRGFFQDYTGLPESRAFQPTIPTFQALSSRISPPLSPPSIDFDPAQSWVSFAVEEGSHQRQDVNLLHIFGDSNYLGNIEISDPFRTTCTRSADGQKIALAQWPGSSEVTSSSIREFDLYKLEQKEYSIPETYIVRMAFSLHTRLIAVAGISPNEDRSGLYIIDTVTDEIKPIEGIDEVISLSWSPDGSQLASLKWLTNRMYSQPNLDIGLYDLEKDITTTFRIPANLPWGKPTVEIPIGEWVARFHLSFEGFEPCAMSSNISP